MIITRDNGIGNCLDVGMFDTIENSLSDNLIDVGVSVTGYYSAVLRRALLAPLTCTRQLSLPDFSFINYGSI